VKIWSCKIGEVDASKLPRGADGPMRDAVARAYRELTGEDPEFLFSGWGAELTPGERSCVDDEIPAEPQSP
jgi:hypothetical protein